MRKVMGWLGVSTVIGMLLLTSMAQADDKEKDKKIPLDKVPKVIMDAIKGRFPGAEVTSVEKEIEDGKVMFDVELTQKGRKYEMDIKEDGTIVEIEKEMDAKKLPAITKAVKSKYPEATIKEIMEVNKVEGKKETPIHYEVTIEMNGKKKEVIVSLDGKTVKTEGEEKKEEKK